MAITFITFSENIAYAQDGIVTNVRTVIGEDKLFIHYDIPEQTNADRFHIQVDLEVKGMKIYPKSNSLVGDYGSGISSGSKLFYWQFGSETKKVIEHVSVKLTVTPETMISYTSTSGTLFVPCTIKFKNNFSSTFECLWDFGDVKSGSSNQSKEQVTSHLFKTAGQYIITLKNYPTNRKEPYTYIYTITVYDSSLAPKASFNIRNNNAYPPATIIFENISTNAKSFSWDFGDKDSSYSNKSIKKNPMHTYFKAGEYEVTLTVRGLDEDIESTTQEIVTILPIPNSNDK